MPPYRSMVTQPTLNKREVSAAGFISLKLRRDEKEDAVCLAHHGREKRVALRVKVTPQAVMQKMPEVYVADPRPQGSRDQGCGRGAPKQGCILRRIAGNAGFSRRIVAYSIS